MKSSNEKKKCRKKQNEKMRMMVTLFQTGCRFKLTFVFQGQFIQIVGFQGSIWWMRIALKKFKKFKTDNLKNIISINAAPMKYITLSTIMYDRELI